MNDLGASVAGPLEDEQLLERLSRLQPLAGGDGEIAAELLRDLQERCLWRPGPLRSFQQALGDIWGPIAVLILSCLLGLDLARIIRWLLG